MRTALVNLLIRRFVKRRLARCRTPLDVRKAFSLPSFAPRGIRLSQAIVGGVTGEWAESKKISESTGTLLYLHGGGYVSMSPSTHRTIAGNFARRGFRVFTPDYRLAPENPFPAALEDAAAVWQALRMKIEGPIFVAGDSSGGGLAVALMLSLRDNGEEGPTAACLFSPWADLACAGDSFKLNRDLDPMQATNCIEMLAISYSNETDRCSPLLSPIYGDMVGLSPLLIFAGSTEVLLDDAKRLAARARSHGVLCDLRIYPDMPHVWPLLNVILPEGRQAFDESAEFLRSAAPRYLSDWLRRTQPLQPKAVQTTTKIRA